jgi:hypothetical protein
MGTMHSAATRSSGRLLTTGIAIVVTMCLAVVAVGCASGDDGEQSGDAATNTTASTGQSTPGVTSNEPGSAASTTTPTTFGGITTTTVFEVVAPDCDPVSLAVASLATISPAYSTVDSYGCDATHAWAWMSVGDSDPDALLSVLFINAGGLWQALDTVAMCTTEAGAGIAAEVLDGGCAHL